MEASQKRIYDLLMESQYWRPEQMLAFQRNQLAQLLRHARQNVPFYKTCLNPVFTKDGDVDWNRWHELPIVKRRHLVDQGESMLATELPPGHGTVREVFSSGSSGTPVTTWHNIPWKGWFPPPSCVAPNAGTT